MAKKVRNLLLLGAAIGAAAAGTYYYLQKKDQEFLDDEDDDAEDFDGFEDDEDFSDLSDASTGRNYVPLHFDATAVDHTEEDVAPEKEVTLEDMNSVEEFFDDEDEDNEIDDNAPIEEEE